MTSSFSGLSGPFSTRKPGYCERCKGVSDATWPWPFWRQLRNGWFVVLGAIVICSPVIMSDYSMLPSAFVLVIAISPLNTLAKVKPTCLRCSGQIDPSVHVSGAAAADDEKPADADHA